MPGFGLDRWLRQKAGLADRQAGVSVRVASNGDQVIGCYRLGAFHVEAQKSPRGGSIGGPPVPAILISRLGVDEPWQHRGLGTALRSHALRVADNAAIPLTARIVVAHAAGEPARGFCSLLGFRPSRSDPQHLYLLTRDIQATRPD